jgi:hypothetical protein
MMMLRGAGSEVDGVWSHSSDTGQLAWAPDSDAASSAGGDPKDGQKCLGLSPGHVADDRVGAGNGSFLSQFCIQKRSFYQDRLGTNVGKVLKTRGDLISPGTSRGPLSPESASMTMQSCATASKPGKKTAFLSHLYIQMLILPRQARDKHREYSKKDSRFAAVPPNTTVFTLGVSSGELRNVGTGKCIGVGQAPGAQVWAKPMSAHELAFVILNPLPVPQQLNVSLADLPGNPCSTAIASEKPGVLAAPGVAVEVAASPTGSSFISPACSLRDVW